MSEKMTAKEFQAMHGKGNNPQKNYQALGRLKSGVMNKMEKKYSQHLDALKYSGEILEWYWDKLNLRLADGCFYKPDFMVLKSDNSLEIHETKGFWTDDALVKIKVAADIFPFRFIAIQLKNGEWEVKEFK